MIKNILERGDVIIVLHGIHVVVYGNIANPMLQKVFFGVITCFRIVSA